MSVCVCVCPCNKYRMYYANTKYLGKYFKMLGLLKSPSNIFKNPLAGFENITVGQLSYNSQQLLVYWSLLIV